MARGTGEGRCWPVGPSGWSWDSRPSPLEGAVPRGQSGLPHRFPKRLLASLLCNLRTNRAESSSFRLPNINLVHKQPLFPSRWKLPGDADALDHGCQRAELTADQSEVLGGSPWDPGDRRLEMPDARAGGGMKEEEPSSRPRSVPSSHSCAQETPAPGTPLVSLSASFQAALWECRLYHAATLLPHDLPAQGGLCSCPSPRSL